jgi:hypothetical protein
MQKRIAVDSGPLIALFDKDDRYHHRAVEFIKELTGELVTNYAVVTEVTHLLDFSIRAQIDFLQWVLDGGVTIADISPDDLRHIIQLVQKYSDLPVDFADATLVALCDRLKIGDIASVDRHFAICRTRDKKAFRNVFFH